MAAARKAAECKLHCCALTPEVTARIKASLVDYYPGKWAEEYGYGPACQCGLRTAKEPCPRHAKGPDDMAAG